MAIKINFDTNDIPEVPTFVLGKKSGDKIGMLSNVTNIQLKDCFNNAPEISFTVHKYDNGNICEYWDEIKDLRTVWCKEWDMWFEMTIDTNISDETIKNVSLVRLAEAELSQTNLYNIEINTELDIARDDYTEPTIIYNIENPSTSLLNRILEKVPHYSIRHVDISIAKIQRTFTFDDKNIVDALQEIATEINALVVFHSGTDENGRIERCISLYDLESNCLDCGYRGEFSDVCPQCHKENIKDGYGEDTTICIDDENMLGDDITLEVDTDSVKNCFKLVAGDDLMTATIINCNPNGTAYIWYLPDTTKDDMSDELRDKVNSYNALYEEYRKTKQFDIPSDLLDRYNSLINNYKRFNQDLENIVSPIIGYPNLMNTYYNTIDFALYLESGLMPSLTTDDITAINQAELLIVDNLSPISVNNINNISETTVKSAILGIAKLIVHPSYKVVINQSSLNDNIWTGNFEVINMSDENDSAISETISITINDDYENFINQKLDKMLNDYYEEFKTDITSLFKKDLDNFKVQLTKYSLNGLNSLYDACQSCIDILIEQGLPNDTKSTLYNSIYLPYYEKLQAISDEIIVRENELNIVTGLYNEDEKGLQNYIDDIRNEMQNTLNFEKYIGTDLWNEFCSFRREDTYENTNYISDGLNNADLFKNALEFIDIAQKDIYKSANLQHKLTSTLKNLLVIKDFRKLVDYFSCGNWIRIKIDDTLYKLRLLEYDIDFDNLDNINVSFSDVTYGVDGMSDTKSVLEQASSMATSYDSVKRQATQGADSNNILQNWIYKGLNATTFNIVNRAENQTQSWDKHGMLYRQYDDITESYLDTQLKIINQGLYITNNNWKTTKTAIGKFTYIDPKDNNTEKEGFGVIADTICSNLILSEEVGIYNANSSIVINKDGISVTDPNNTSSSKPSVTITPDGTLTCNGAKINGNITAISGEIGDFTINQNYLYCTTTGLSGNSDRYAFWAGETNSKYGLSGSSNSKFYVTHDGYLYANNAKIAGSIDISNGLLFYYNNILFGKISRTTSSYNGYSYVDLNISTSSSSQNVSLKLSSDDRLWINANNIYINAYDTYGNATDETPYLYLVSDNILLYGSTTNSKASIGLTSYKINLTCSDLNIQCTTNANIYGYSSLYLSTNNTFSIHSKNVRISCGNYSTSDNSAQVIRFNYDSNNHALFRPSVDGQTYLGSGGSRWKIVYSIDGDFTNITAKSINDGSDRRIKHDINYDIKNDFEELIYNGIKPVSFYYNLDQDEMQMKRYGIIAQDLRDWLIENDKEQFAGLVIKKNENCTKEDLELNLETNEDDVEYFVNYIQFITPLISVVQNQKKEIEELKQLVNNLIEGKV